MSKTIEWFFREPSVPRRFLQILGCDYGARKILLTQTVGSNTVATPSESNVKEHVPAY
jgi:hypothetical protein